VSHKATPQERRAAEPPPAEWKALLGAELSEPRPDKAGPTAAAGPGRGRR
jgi:hypothetical protein